MRPEQLHPHLAMVGLHFVREHVQLPTDGLSGVAADRRRQAQSNLVPMSALTQLSNYLTLKGSFSAVSKPEFASKYALESSRRDLQKCTPLPRSRGIRLGGEVYEKKHRENEKWQS